MLDDTGLLDTLRRALGPVEVVGSVGLDLMVWRDVDLYARLDRGEGARLVSLLPTLYDWLGREGWEIVRISFNNEYRRPGNPYGRGLYLGLLVLPPGEAEAWKIDLWGWDEETFRGKIMEHRALSASLAEADRDLVLRIKDAVHRRREYRDTLTAADVYAFATERAGTTLAEFDEFVSRRRSG